MISETTVTRRVRRARFAVVLALAVGMVGACSSSDGGGSEGARRGSTSTTTATRDVDRVLSVGDGPGAGRVVAMLDPRYQSYNIEMVEVTGGQFWKPYDAGPGKVVRPPIDLGSERLRNLARALGPAYIRVSGSWANSTYFDVDGTSGGVAPNGFQSVLTTDQWRGVGDFARAVDGKVLTSFASSPGVRDAQGAWRDDQARALLRFSQDNHVPVAAVELFNEPNLPVGMPSGYTGRDFQRDVATFTALVREVMPSLKTVGPGTTGEVLELVLKPPLRTVDMLSANGPRFDRFSYHFYPKVSPRCGSTEGPEVALTQGFLSRLEPSKQFYEGLRDRFDRGAPMWVTETAEAACGGDRWASTYRDVIRYVDTLGRLGDGNGNVVFHNTLAASDYGLIDEKDLQPRPDYWAAVLWARLMGPKVLAVEPGTAPADLAVYAHCTPNAKQPSVTYAVVNSSATESRTVATKSGSADVSLLSSDALDSGTISLNGTTLTAAADGTSPPLRAQATRGAITLPPASVAFVVAPTDVGACG